MVRLLGVTALFVTLVAAPAQAQSDRVDVPAPSRQAGPGLAWFEGRTIDLSQDWGEARACLVWRQGGVFQCFRNAEALDALEAQLARRRDASGPSHGGPSADTAAYDYGYSCSSSLRLYEYNWYGGRRLSFWDRGFWQNLGDYGFEDRTSSYIVGGCYVWLAEHGDGGGAWYPGPTYPYAGVPAMYYDWQDTISSIYVG